MATMHEVDFKIFGDDMQFVEVELDGKIEGPPPDEEAPQ